MSELQNIISLSNVGRLVFGWGAFSTFQSDFVSKGKKRLFVLSIPPMAGLISDMAKNFCANGIEVLNDDQLAAEPTFSDFEHLLEKVRSFNADSILALGGGSVMDTAKFLAAMIDSPDDYRSFIGIGLVKSRNTYLACIPTTAGTGSEVSPNAIFLDETDQTKKGVISPFLVPDAAYVDPELTIGVPARITAATGIDAFTHCLEAFVNNFSHPLTDLLAFEGMKLIAENLVSAVRNGNDVAARTAVALGSLYGGMCLGPVNTGAIHALAYPLGSRYKVAHGLSNAVMMPYVVRFNQSAAPEKYQRVAGLFQNLYGQSIESMEIDLALMLKRWVTDCGLPSSIVYLGILPHEIGTMAADAIKVQRLLKNNVREVSFSDAEEIYKMAFAL